MLCALTNAARVNFRQSTLGATSLLATTSSTVPSHIRPTSHPLQQQRNCCVSTELIGVTLTLVGAAHFTGDSRVPGWTLVSIGSGLLLGEFLLKNKKED